MLLIKRRASHAPEWAHSEAVERLAGVSGALEAPISGTVYGVVLNVRSQVQRYAAAMDAAPYKAPPQAPVLYIKPPNTYAGHGAAVSVPEGVEALEIAGVLGVVMGRATAQVSAEEAMDAVLGFVPALDATLPHESLYRPAIRQRCRDGYLPIGPGVAVKEAVGLNDLAVVTYVNGVERCRYSTAELVRPIGQLIADVTAFMTLAAGDVLLVGLPGDAPSVVPGDVVECGIDGVGRLGARVVREGQSEVAA